MRLELIPCSPEGDVGLVSHAPTTGEHGNDTAFSVKDDGTTPAVGHNGGLEGGKLEVAVDVVTNKGFESVYSADGSIRGQAVLNNRHHVVAVGIELLGLANLALGHDAVDLEEAILRVLIVSPVRVVGVHEVAELLLDLAPCVIINELSVSLELELRDEAR